MFREAGLDPEKPPRTIAELESFNEKLTRKKADGSLAQIGHMPQEPGWWMHDFPSWFGGASWDGGTQLLLDATPNRHFFGWLESYPRRFGGPAMFQLRGAFGNFASPDNPFFNGKVAMIMQGVWMNNFIKNYAPAGFEYGVAAFPEETEHPGAPMTVAETDILVIPAGAHHPKEAMEFIAFVEKQKNMENLCLGQRKISPLRRVSDDFVKNHSHPYLRTFLQLANSPRAQPTLALPTFKEYANDLTTYVNLVLLGRMPAEQARSEMLGRQQKALNAKLARWNQVAPVRVSHWETEVQP
jgi:ABC-type glycerol-3-phosphate transport system substrate-binding protein